MNRIWLIKPNGYDKHILLADNPVEIGNSARLKTFTIKKHRKNK